MDKIPKGEHQETEKGQEKQTNQEIKQEEI